MIARMLAAALLLTASSLSSAQNYPTMPIRLVSPFPPGGGTDLIARTIAAKLIETKQWTVVVDNRAGANGTIGVAEVSRANPAGYDLVIGQKDNLILAPLLQKVPFDTVKDFSPIAYIGGSPVVFLSASNGKYQNFEDVIAAVKTKPNAVTMGTSGSGSVAHITTEVMRKRANLSFQHVPYKGSTQALTDLLGGQIDIVGSSIASANSLIQAGKIKPLAVSGATRSPSLPDVPTLAELGVRNVEVDIWYGLLGPAGLRPELARQLNAAVNQIIQRPDVAKILRDQGLQPMPRSPEEFARLVRNDYDTWKGILAETGVKLD